MSRIFLSLLLGLQSYLTYAQKLPTYFACHTTERCEYIVREHQKEFSQYPIKIYDSCPKVKFSDNRKIVSIGEINKRALSCEEIHQSIIMTAQKYKKPVEKMRAIIFSQTKTLKDYLFNPKSYEYYKTPRDQGLENYSGNCQNVFGMLNFGKDLRESNQKVCSRLRMAGLEDFGKYFIAHAKIGGELNKVNQNSYWELVRAAGLKSLLNKYLQEYGNYPRGINEKACSTFKDALPKDLFKNTKKELTTEEIIKIESQIKKIETQIQKETKYLRSLSRSILGKLNIIATGDNSKLNNAKLKIKRLTRILSQKKKFLKEGKINLIDNLTLNSDQKRVQLVNDAHSINKLTKQLKEQYKVLSKNKSTLSFLLIGVRKGQSYGDSYIRKIKEKVKETKKKIKDLKTKIHDFISRNKVFALDRSKGLWTTSDWDEDELVEDNPWLKSFLRIKDHNSKEAKKLTELAIIREEKELRKAIYSFCQVPSDSFRASYIGTSNTNNNSCTDFDNSYPGFESDLKEYAFTKEQIRHICDFKYNPFTPYQLAKFELLNKTVLEAYPTLNQYYQCMSEYADKDQQTMTNLEVFTGLGCLATLPITGLTLSFVCTFSLEAPLVISNFNKKLDHLEYQENCFLTQKECTPEMIKASNDSFNEQTIAMILVILGEPAFVGIDAYNTISKYNKLLAKKTSELNDYLKYFKESDRKKFSKELKDIEELNVSRPNKIKLLNKLLSKANDEKLLTKINQINFNNNDITIKLIDDHLQKLGIKNLNKTILNYSKSYDLNPENVFNIIKYSKPDEVILNLEKAKTDLRSVLTKLYASEYFKVIQKIESVSRKFPDVARRSLNIMTKNAKIIAFTKKYPSIDQYIYQKYTDFIPDENIIEQIISAKEKYSIPYEEVIRIYSQNTKPYIPKDLNGINVYKSNVSLEDFSAVKGDQFKIYKAKELIEDKLSKAKKHIKESNEFIKVIFDHLYSKSNDILPPTPPKLYEPIDPGLKEALNILSDTTLEYSMLGSPYKYLDDVIFKGHRIAKRRMLLTEAENLRYILKRFPEYKERIINALNKIDYTEVSIVDLAAEDILIDGRLKSDFLRSQMSDLLNSKRIINIPDEQLKEKFNTILNFIENPEKHGTAYDPNKHIFIDNNIITYKRKGKSPKKWLLDYFETQKQKEAVYSPGVYIESIVKADEPVKIIKRDKSIIREEQFLDIINELHRMSIGGHPERYRHSDNLPINKKVTEFTDDNFKSGYMDQKIFAEYLASTPKGIRPPPIFITDDKGYVKDFIIGQFLPKIENEKVLWRDDKIFNWNKLGTTKEKFEKLLFEFKDYYYSMNDKPYPKLNKLRAINDNMIDQLKTKVKLEPKIIDDLLKEFDPNIHINLDQKVIKKYQYQKRYPCGITLKIAGRYMKVINPEIDKAYFLEHCK